jgi:hypothetical protein
VTGAHVAQFQIRLREASLAPDEHWVNCPDEAMFLATLSTSVYEGRRLYTQPTASTERVAALEAMLRELLSARPLLLYGEQWIAKIAAVLAG